MEQNPIENPLRQGFGCAAAALAALGIFFLVVVPLPLVSAVIWCLAALCGLMVLVMAVAA
jgi:hypothetical protein